MAGGATAQDALPEKPADADALIALYPSTAPGSETWHWHEMISNPPWGGRGGRIVRNVVQPTLTLFKPVNVLRANHTAVIVAPGGGFRWLSIDSEGYEVARALAAHGITALVLKYRLQHTADDESKFVAESMAFLKEVASMKPGADGKLKMPLISTSPTDNPAIVDGIAAVRYCPEILRVD